MLITLAQASACANPGRYDRQTPLGANKSHNATSGRNEQIYSVFVPWLSHIPAKQRPIPLSRTSCNEYPSDHADGRHQLGQYHYGG